MLLKIMISSFNDKYKSSNNKNASFLVNTTLNNKDYEIFKLKLS